MMPFSNITSHQDSQDRFTVGEVSGSSHDASGHRGEEPEVFPEAMKVIGILRERLTGGEKWEVSLFFKGHLGRWVFVGAYCVWNDLLGINVFWKLNQIHHTKNLKQEISGFVR